MMLHDLAPDLVAERQEYLRSLVRPAVRDDLGGVRSMPRIPRLGPDRIVEVVRKYLRPRLVPPLRGTA